MIKSVKIGPMKYQVQKVKNLNDGGRSLWGWIKHGEGKICLEEGLSGQRAAVTILHEIIHGLFDQAGLKHKEKVIDVIAFGIYGVIRDNPGLVRWLQEIRE